MWCIHNAMEFEKRGVLTTTVCTSQFAFLLRKTSAVMGFSNLAVVDVSHPIAGIDLVQVRKKAEGIVEDVVGIITRP